MFENNSSSLVLLAVLIVSVLLGGSLIALFNIVLYQSKFSTKIAAAAVAITTLFTLGLGYLTTELYYTRLKQGVESQRDAKMGAVTQELGSTDRSLLRQVKASMQVLRNESLMIGAPSLGATTQVTDKTVPNLLFKNTPQANNFAIVDKVKQLMGGTATLFVKSGENFVRVSTNVQKDDGTRAVGTVLDPNGKAIAQIRQGNAFYGVVRILGKPYITGYEPILDQNKETIGIWYVGYALADLAEFAELEQYISNEKVLENGFLALLDEKGEVVFKSANADNSVLAIAAKPEAGETFNEWKIKKQAFEPWNYTAVTAYSENDPLLAGPIGSLRFTVFTASFLFLIVLSILIVLLIKYYLRPLGNAVKVANQIAEGKINSEVIEATTNDEIGAMLGATGKMKDYLQRMTGIADKIAAGDTNVEVRPLSEDDRFGNAFKNMFERTLIHIQTQEERNQLQRSIMKLLEEVSDVANGDLTAEAEVTADATGAIADAFNYMIIELRDIIGQVKQTSLQVNNSASEIRATTDSLRVRSETQSSQLLELSTKLESMSNTMQQVAQNTNNSADVSDNALSNAKKGTLAMQNNINSMNRLRSRVQETAERMKRLGERSQEISSIVKIINDLAQRTSILALNASIQASAAGQQGRGFVAVADEVERLAERSATASKQIDVLTKAIQGETNEAVVAMETTVKEVAVGVKLTGEVGAALGEIESVSVRLAAMSQEIAVSARQQAMDSVEISSVMRNVASVSTATATGMKESAENVNQLAEWSEELRLSVASFRLPESNEEQLSETIAKTGALPTNMPQGALVG